MANINTDMPKDFKNHWNSRLIRYWKNRIRRGIDKHEKDLSELVGEQEFDKMELFDPITERVTRLQTTITFLQNIIDRLESSDHADLLAGRLDDYRADPTDIADVQRNWNSPMSHVRNFLLQSDEMIEDAAKKFRERRDPRFDDVDS